MKIQLGKGDGSRKRGREDSEGAPPRKRAKSLKITLRNRDDASSDGDLPSANAEIVGVSFARIAMDREGHNHKCCGCRGGFGPVEDPVADPIGHQFWTLYRDLCVNASAVEMVRQLALFHKHHYRPNRRLEGKPCPEWTANEIHEHIFVHMYNPHTDRLGMIRDARLLELELKDTCVYRMPDGRRVVDSKAIAAYLKMVAHHKSLMRLDPNTCFGANPT